MTLNKFYSLYDYSDAKSYYDRLIKKYHWLFDLFEHLNESRVQLSHSLTFMKREEIYLWLGPSYSKGRRGYYYGPFNYQEEVVNFLVTASTEGDLSRWVASY